MKAICAQGTRVERIVVFAAHNVPVATRHRLQTDARENHNVGLEVLDGEAIAELLADRELFWIAEEYLHLPAELQPPARVGEPALPDWYTGLRHEGQAPEAAPVSHGDLLELAGRLRHATFHQDARGDLPGWLSLVERLLGNAPGHEKRQRARYEIAVATLRGTGTLRPAEPHVRDFFDEIDTIDNPTLLLDASVLKHCEGANRRGATDLTLQKAAAWNAEVRRRVDVLLAEMPTPDRCCICEAYARRAGYDRASLGASPMNRGRAREWPVG